MSLQSASGTITLGDRAARCSEILARYLIQDHRFLDSFLVLLGAALANADTFAARLRFGRFIGMVSAEENTYFLRAFEALGVTETRRAAGGRARPRLFALRRIEEEGVQ